MTVVDPASGQPIGVVTIGLDAEGDDAVTPAVLEDRRARLNSAA
jgi:hypothetical protein